MNYDDLLVEKRDGIATITLNVPDKMNALSMKMRKSLPVATDDLNRDDEVKVVIVTGAGRAFCAGGDIDSMKARMEGTFQQTRFEKLQAVGYWGDVFVKMDKPVIAAINGAAVGAGFALALSCDIRIASEKARFGCAFILRGLVPDSGTTFFLPRVVGTEKALELMLTGELFDAAEAFRLGIVSRVVSPDDLMKTAQELAAKFAQQPPIAVELTKRVVYRGMIDDIKRQIDWESGAQQICMQSEDHKESIRAFLEKREQPKFKGK